MSVTPLQPREFFQGVWIGEGELIPHSLAKLFVRRQHVRLLSEAVWLSESVWVVKDRFECSSGQVVDRKMFCELVSPDRVHVTADDMPSGADILLEERRFRFTPYRILVTCLGWPLRLRCTDECRINDDGFVHNTVKMHCWGIPVATMYLGPIDRTGKGGI